MLGLEKPVPCSTMRQNLRCCSRARTRNRAGPSFDNRDLDTHGRWIVRPDKDLAAGLLQHPLSERQYYSGLLGRGMNSAGATMPRAGWRQAPGLRRPRPAHGGRSAAGNADRTDSESCVRPVLP